MDGFSVMQRVMLVYQRLEFWAASSPCPHHCRAEYGFLLILPFPSCQMLLGKRECLYLVETLHPCSCHDPPREIQCSPNQTPGTRLCYTVHVPNKVKVAIVVMAIRITHRNCFHLYHTCSQRIIGSCRSDDFQVDWVWKCLYEIFE